MKKKKWGGFFRLFWMTAIVLAIFLGFMMGEAQAPVEDNKIADQSTQPPAASVSENREKVAPRCQVLQTMAFTRCGHTVTRRVEAPEALIGADFACTQAYYPLWQIESFSGEQIAMRREIPLFCPMHVVLSVNEAGETVLCKNMYGDGLAALKSYGVLLEDFDETDQEALILGIGFDSEAEADAWVEQRKNPQGR